MCGAYAGTGERYYGLDETDCVLCVERDKATCERIITKYGDIGDGETARYERWIAQLTSRLEELGR